MKAARFHAREDVRIDDLPEPETREGTVKIKVDWCGICGTDLHEYLEGPIFTPAEAPHPLTGERNPVQLGHEFAGHVTEVGSGVTGFAEGDAVTVEPTLFCGECAECRAGLTNLCRSLGFHGLSGGGGGFAEYTAVPASMVRPLGQVPTDLGALVEPLAVGLHAVRKSGVRIGESAVVFGAGPIGLATITMLRAAGVTKVISVEVAQARKQLAEQTGASVVIADLNAEKGEALKPASDLERQRDEYLKNNVTEATEQQVRLTREGIKNFDFGMKQINVNGDQIVDRCESCHLGIRSPIPIRAVDMMPAGRGRRIDPTARAFVSHPNPELLKTHDPERFGCSSCHWGNGRATTSAATGHPRPRPP
jgi:(R,R)-butanediol dehydrogenase/meso-butanediol dehydrogenase/diacetyl reductase